MDLLEIHVLELFVTQELSVLDNLRDRLFAGSIYAAAPEMKNHLSILGSIGAGARFSLAGT